MAEMKLSKGMDVLVYTTMGWIKGIIYEIHVTGNVTVRISPILKGKPLKKYYPKESFKIWPTWYIGVTVAPAYIRESPFSNEEASNG